MNTIFEQKGIPAFLFYALLKLFKIKLFQSEIYGVFFSFLYTSIMSYVKAVRLTFLANFRPLPFVTFRDIVPSPLPHRQANCSYGSF